ncbi:MAG TPA: hypothetical protein EYG68_06770 [Leucothrix mucor]|nr:hypothetical protein [Leucothrix mucor]
MSNTTNALTPQKVPAGVGLVSPSRDPSKKINEDAPAISVMTDLKVITPFQTTTSSSIGEANDKMVACGVRLLFVHDEQDQLMGLITSKDTLGEKPMLFVKDNGGKYADITVNDIMTPLSKLDAIPLEAIENSTVGDIVNGLQNCKRHHMLVLQTREDRTCIRGIISITQVGRQLGKEICPTRIADSFAELNKART